jgi:peroxiredoxin
MEMRRAQGRHARPQIRPPAWMRPLWIGILLAGLPGSGIAGSGDPLAALGLTTPKEAVEGPAFALPDLAGKTVRLADFRGKLVFLNFFATWCGPCRDEMPAMERIHQAHKAQGLVVLAVDAQESVKAVRAFREELKLTFPTLIDADGVVSLKYGVRALPVSFLINRDGFIRWRAIGSRPWEGKPARQYFARVAAEKP